MLYQVNIRLQLSKNQIWRVNYFYNYTSSGLNVSKNYETLLLLRATAFHKCSTKQATHNICIMLHYARNLKQPLD